MYPSLRCTSSIRSAIAWETATSRSWLRVFTLRSNNARRTEGNTTALLTWFEKSDLPVATTLAPAANASAGYTSGSGLLSASTIQSRIIDSIVSLFRIPAFPDTPMNTSAPLIISDRLPCNLFLVGLFCNFILVIVLTGIVAVPAFIDCSPTICYNEIFVSRFPQYFEDAVAGRTCPRYDYSYAANLFLY